MTDREKMIELIEGALEHASKQCEKLDSCCVCPHGEHGGCQSAFILDYLIANGVTFATDTNVLGELSGNSELFKWISVEDEKPKEFVSVLGHMTDAGDFPAVRECYLVGNVFFFPSLRDRHPVDKWMPMPEGE